MYYDCTNYFFEIEEAEGIKQYGKNKENRPLPIVQMGLFMDGDGFPLAFSIDSGNTLMILIILVLMKKYITKKIDKNRQNDPKRFIKSASVTNDGEIADKKVFALPLYIFVIPHFKFNFL